MFSLFLPERCVHCDEPSRRSLQKGLNNALDRYLCGVCARILEFQDGPEEQFLRGQFDLVASHVPIAACHSKCWFSAESPVQSIVHALKYSGMPRLAREFGRTLAPFVPSADAYIVPIPLHRTRMAERGYNQAEALAKGIAEESGGSVVHALRRTRPTPSQTHLTLPERIQNVRGAFALRRGAALYGKDVLLIDDVMTTGSTLASAAEALMAAQPKSIGIITLAAAQK